MRWAGRRESDNVEDRRGAPLGGMAVRGGLGTLVLVLIFMYFGIDPRPLLQQQPGPAVNRGAPQEESAEEAEARKFVSVVLADTEDVWNELFQRMGKPYREPAMVLYADRVQSGCGAASSGVGPFYCPADQKVYLDLSFLNELRDRFDAPGDFAVAYVIAHEVGHHVQEQLGISDQMQAARGRVSEKEYNRLSVRLELQADFLAGVWAHHAQRSKQILDPGDVEEALGAASAVGDDRIQRQTRGEVVPDAFTHGTSAQRVRWFKKGFESGDVSQMEQLFDLPDNRL